ncbi:SAM-dependent methyltransferase [Streptomyces sp. NPDC006798]|uniref:SAM-dependent methyltransferase n=1 Tax=Streptomyces sp. NPDC006798 TaxID=3155462 RepID=UPI0033C44062
MNLDDLPVTTSLDHRGARSARIHDWLAMGIENYRADREAAIALLDPLPQAEQHVRTGRAFLQHTVRTLATDGFDQFVDLGCGLPTWHRGNTHEAAQAIHPTARVVYVDTDPMVLAHARTELEDNEHIRTADCDLRDLAALKLATADFLDWDRRLAVLLSMVLDCLPDEDGLVNPADVVRTLADGLPPDSVIAVVQLVSDDPTVRNAVTEIMTATTGGRWGRMRDTAFIHQCTRGLEIIPPGPGDVTILKPGLAPRRRKGRQDTSATWGALIRTPAAPTSTSPPPRAIAPWTPTASTTT